MFTRLFSSFFFFSQDEFIKMLNMAPSFMQSIYRDDTTYDQNLDVIWYSRLLSGNAFADILETGQLKMRRHLCLKCLGALRLIFLLACGLTG
jgi:hypothetical protein